MSGNGIAMRAARLGGVALALAGGCASCGGRATPAGAARTARPVIAYVANSGSGTVTPILAGSNRAERPVRVGRDPEQVLVSRDGATVYVAGHGGQLTQAGPATLTAIRTGPAAAVTIRTLCTAGPGDHLPMAITPDQRTLYYLCPSANKVIPVRASTLTAGPPINAGPEPDAVAVTPDGKTAYVASLAAGTVTPISTATSRPGAPIRVGNGPVRIAITPDGRTAYVLTEDAVVPVTVATNSPGRPISVPGCSAMAITPDGRTVLVVSTPDPDSDQGVVVPVDTATGARGRPIRVGLGPGPIAITPDGAMAYVPNYGSGTITPIRVATGTAETAIKVGKAPANLAITPDGAIVYVVNSNPYGFDYRSGTLTQQPGSVTPIRVATGTAGKPIAVGIFPIGIAIGSAMR